MSILSVISRLAKADKDRKTRFHTMAGDFVFSRDIVPALSSTIKRSLFSKYEHLPWITYPAIRFLNQQMRGRRVFEFGSGTSSLWYAERAKEVFSVENNLEWFQRVQAMASGATNLTLSFAEENDDFINRITQIGGSFDAIVIDSQPKAEDTFTSTDDFRVACLRTALQYASEDCMFIIDNTDAMRQLSAEVDKVFPANRIRRMTGWVPGIFHPNETTIIN
jgi:hypothetical protein